MKMEYSLKCRGIIMGLETDEKIINYIKKKIVDARHIVAVLGIEMLVEGGGYDLDSNEETYRAEEIYGYTPEDMLSTSFFNAKVERFYRFYKNEILTMEVKPTPAYDALLELQARGKLSAVISQNFHGIPQGIHFNNVIELNGNIHSNKCSHCNKIFGLSYMKDAPGIPLCDSCKTAVRPNIRLIGERVNAKAMTAAANACEAADVLLIMGKNMYNDRLEYNTDPSRNQLKVLFSKEEQLSDRRVDFVIHDEIQLFLPAIV